MSVSIAKCNEWPHCRHEQFGGGCHLPLPINTTEALAEVCPSPKPRKDRTVLDEARGLVHGDRNASYGNPWTDMGRTAKMWAAILGVEVRAEQVALCMCAVKISRQVNSPKRDNMVDLAGYAECVDWIVEEEKSNKP